MIESVYQDDIDHLVHTEAAYSREREKLVICDGIIGIRILSLHGGPDLSEPRLLRHIVPEGGGIRDLEVFPDGTIAAATEILPSYFTGHTFPDGTHPRQDNYENKLKLWSPEGDVFESIRGHSKDINCIAVSPDGRYAATGSSLRDGNRESMPVAAVWDRRGMLVRDFGTAVEKVDEIAFSSDGSRILLADRSSYMKRTLLWTVTGEFIKEFGGEYEEVKFSRGFRRIVTLKQGVVELWSPEGEKIGQIEAAAGSFTSINVQPDGSFFTAEKGGPYRLWTDRGGPVRTYTANPDAELLWFSAEETVVRTGYGSVLLLDAQNRRKRVLESGADFSDYFFLASRDGRYFARFGRSSYTDRRERVQLRPASEPDNAVKVWTKEGRLVGVFEGGARRIDAAVFTPCGRYIAAGYPDGSVRKWDIETGELTTLVLRNGRSLVFDAQGWYKASGNPQSAAAGLRGNSEGGHEPKAALPADELAAVTRGVSAVPLGRIDAGSGRKDVTAEKDSRTVVEKNTTASSVEMVVQQGHMERINCLAVHPDKKFFVTGSGDTNPDILGGKRSFDNTVRVWNFQGRLIRRLSGHTRGVVEVAVGADGRVASLDIGGTVNVWSAGGGLLGTIYTDSGWNRLAFAPAGALAVSAGEIVRVYDPDLGLVTTVERQIGEPGGLVDSILFTPDGTKIVISRGSGISIAGRDGTVLNTIKTASADTALSIDGNLIINSGFDGIEYYSLDGKLIKKKSTAEPDACFLESSPDGRYFAYGSSDFYNADTASTYLYVMDGNWNATAAIGHPYEMWRITGAAFGPKNEVVTVFEDSSIYIWDTKGRELISLSGTETRSETGALEDQDTVIAVSPGGTVATSAGRYIKLWAPDGKFLKTIEAHGYTVSGLSFSKDGILASASGNTLYGGFSDNHQLKFWSREGELIRSVQVPSVGGLDWSPDGSVLAVLQTNGKIVLRNRRGEKTGSYSRNPREYYSHADLFDICFSPDGEYLAANVSDKTEMWSLEGRLVRTLTGKTAQLHSVDFSPDGKFLVTTTGSRVFFTDLVQGGLLDLEKDSVIHLWSFEGELLNTIHVPDTQVYAAAFTPDGSIVSAFKNTLQVRNRDGKLLKHIAGPAGEIRNIVSGADGSVVSVNKDGSGTFWNLETGGSVTFYSDRDEWVMYSPEGYFDCSLNGNELAGLSRESSSYNIDQFAATHNRPDILLGITGSGRSEQGKIRHFFLQYIKRLVKLDLLPQRIPDERFLSLLESIEGKGRALLKHVYKKEGSDYVLRKDVSKTERYLLTLLPPYLAYLESRIGGMEHVPHTDILAYKKEGKFVNLEFRCEEKATELLTYNIFVNDVPIYGGGGKPLDGKTAVLEERIELNPGINKIEASCRNSAFTESFRDVVTVYYDGEIESDLYYIGFGVSEYKNPELNLGYPHKDVADLARELEAMETSFKNVYTRTFVDRECRVENIREAKDFLEGASVDDTAVLFISGHGMHARDAEARYYYLTHETDLKDLENSAAEFELIEEILDGIAPRKKLFLMDTCESGDVDEVLLQEASRTARLAGFRARTIRGLVPEEEQDLESELLPGRGQLPARSYLQDRDRFIYQDILRRTGAVVFSSSGGGELSYEPPVYREDGNGFFTTAVLESLRAIEADSDQDGFVAAGEMEAFVRKRVSERSEGLQNPTIDRDNIFQHVGLPMTGAGFAYAEAGTGKKGAAGEEALREYFWKAVESGNLQRVRFFVSEGADVEAVREDGSAPLHVSAAAGYKELVLYFLESGVNPDVRNKRGKTAAQLAFEAGHSGITDVLIEAGALIPPSYVLSFGEKDERYAYVGKQLFRGRAFDTYESGLTKAFIKAVEEGNPLAVDLFITGGADPNTRDRRGRTLLSAAAAGDHVGVMEQLIAAGADIEAGNDKKYGMTALMYGAISDSPDSVVLLLDAGAEIAKKDASGNTALMYACEYRKPETAAALIDRGAGVNITDTSLKTPLMHAVGKVPSGHGNRDDLTEREGKVIDVLFEAGAVTYYVDEEIQDALVIALENKRFHAAQLLLDHGVNPDSPSCRESPLLLALQKRSWETAQQIVLRGADLTLEKHQGSLSSVISYTKIGLLKLLLENGADPSERGFGGWIPLIGAVSRFDGPEGAELLIRAGAELDTVNKRGMTALSTALKEGKLETFRVLIRAGADPGVPVLDGITVEEIVRYPGFEPYRAVLEEED
jgi:WD40 repeat protein/ankyrin repeat protein